MNNEPKGLRKEVFMPKSKYYPGILPADLRKTTKNLSIYGVPAEIRTDDLPNTSLKRCCYVNLLRLKENYLSPNCLLSLEVEGQTE
jgi:hypothetical protein